MKKESHYEIQLTLITKEPLTQEKIELIERALKVGICIAVDSCKVIGQSMILVS